MTAVSRPLPPDSVLNLVSVTIRNIIQRYFTKIKGYSFKKINLKITSATNYEPIWSRVDVLMKISVIRCMHKLISLNKCYYYSSDNPTVLHFRGGVLFFTQSWILPWWRHQMETFSALLALCAGNSPVPVTSPHKAITDLRLHKRLSKQSWGWWFDTPSWSLWRQCNASSENLFKFTSNKTLIFPV